jgi:hypothetical protein
VASHRDVLNLGPDFRPWRLTKVLGVAWVLVAVSSRFQHLVVAATSGWVKASLGAAAYFAVVGLAGMEALSAAKIIDYLAVLLRLRAYVVGAADAMFCEVKVDAYLEDLRASTRASDKVLRRDVTGPGLEFPPLEFPLETHAAVDFHNGPAPTVRVIHQTAGGQNALPTYACFTPAFHPAFVFTSIGPDEITPVHRFFLFHEIGHALRSDRLRRSNFAVVAASAAVAATLLLPLLGSGAVSWSRWALLVLTNAVLLWLVALQPKDARESSADTFALANCSDNTVELVLDAVRADPHLFDDPSLHPEAVARAEQNTRRHARLVALATYRLKEPQTFFRDANLQMLAFTGGRRYFFGLMLGGLTLSWLCISAGAKLGEAGGLTWRQAGLAAVLIVLVHLATLVGLVPAIFHVKRRVELLTPLPLDPIRSPPNQGPQAPPSPPAPVSTGSSVTPGNATEG